MGGRPNESAVPLKASNRLIAAEGRSGALAAFPPPHTFFWTREVETNLGYVWYRKDTGARFAIGIRQAEREEEERYLANFALYSAPPGSVQRMPVYFYVSGGDAQSALDRRPRVHAKRSLQGAARLPGHGEPLSHGSRSADARVGQPRHEAAGSRGAARDRDQHREPDRSAVGRRPARDSRRLLRGRSATLRYELPDHAERGGEPVPWRPLGPASVEAALTGRAIESPVSRSSRTTRSTARSIASARRRTSWK